MQTAWAIKRPDDEIILSSIRFHDKWICMHDFLNGCGDAWLMYENDGYTCVKVEIREVEDEN